MNPGPLVTSIFSLAADASPATQGIDSNPLIPRQLLWPGVAVIVLIAIFVTAALAGPLIRANQQDDVGDSEEKKD